MKWFCVLILTLALAGGCATTQGTRSGGESKSNVVAACAVLGVIGLILGFQTGGD